MSRRACSWPGCPQQVPANLWGCRDHWYRLPKAIRDRIWGAYRPGQEEDLELSTGYVAAYREALEWARRWEAENGAPATDKPGLVRPDGFPGLSLWQPWATLLAIGAKRYETRSWSTSYRGPLAIAASVQWKRETAGLCWDTPFREALEAAGVRFPAPGPEWFPRRLPKILPLGVVVGLVDLVDVVPTDPRPDDADDVERAFGDWSPGRFAWRAENPRPLPEPIPLAGKQGLFAAPAEVLEAIADQLDDYDRREREAIQALCREEEAGR